MSLQGKLLRGLKWHKFRDVNGKYHKDVADSPHKMEEVNFYLDFLKHKDEKKVHKLLEKLMLLDLQNKPRLMEEKAKELSGDFKKEVPKTPAQKSAETKARNKAAKEN